MGSSPSCSRRVSTKAERGDGAVSVVSVTVGSPINHRMIAAFLETKLHQSNTHGESAGDSGPEFYTKVLRSRVDSLEKRDVDIEIAMVDFFQEIAYFLVQSHEVHHHPRRRVHSPLHDRGQHVVVTMVIGAGTDPEGFAVLLRIGSRETQLEGGAKFRLVFQSRDGQAGILPPAPGLCPKETVVNRKRSIIR